MDKISAIIENEKEWRRVIYTDLKDVKKTQCEHGKQIARLSGLAWITRGLTLGVFGVIFAWIQMKLKP